MSDPVLPVASAPVPEPWLTLLTLLLGFATGALSGMFGVGGAVISTPGIRSLGASPIEAVGSTLPSIIPSSITGSLRYARAGLIRARVVAVTGLTGAVASVAGAVLAEVIPGNGRPLMLATAILIAITSFRMRRGPTERELATAEPIAATPVDETAWRLVVIGAVAGLLSGLLGIGGGIVMVPMFTVWLGLDVKEAVGSSLACVGLLALPGTVTHAALDNVDWSFAIPLAVAAVPGAWTGAHITIGAEERTVRLLVSSVLGGIAVLYAVLETVALVS